MRNVRKTRRTTGAVRTGVVAAAAGIAAFGFGGVAHAQDSAHQDGARQNSAHQNSARQDGEPKVVDGECDSTLKGQAGEALTVDAGAAAGVDGVADIGTASTGNGPGGGTGGESTLVSLPLKETLVGTGLSESGVVVDSLGRVCDTAQGTVNTLGATTRDVADGLTPGEPAPDEPGDPEQPGDPEPEPEPNPDRPAPGGPGGPGEDAPGTDVPPAPGAPILPPAGQGVLAEPLDPVSLPPAADVTVPKAPVGPSMDVPDRGSRPGQQENTTRQSGTARAMPQAAETDRTPLVLSVGALLAVVAGLSRAWITRKNA
ncbi:hypothetical protein GCM10009676_41340 [Prauserella halophila]|uniref:Small secreted domain DUF320 n=1 Tax=Prauserella halophila TaxID=185641 RepID=A0ABN1WJ84_9PSEU|nr:hypothetical protein [Prauserella halophila]MCP2236712.1 hypothetical protein [Prauserella halophila]